jgi:membrane protein involved in colicin uptake
METKDSPNIFSSTGEADAFSGTGIKGPNDSVKNRAKVLDERAEAAEAAKAETAKEEAKTAARKAEAEAARKAEAAKKAAAERKAPEAERKAPAAGDTISELKGMMIKDESDKLDIAPADNLPQDFFEKIQNQQQKTSEGI